MDLMEKVENQEFLRELDQEHTLKDAKKLKFDLNNRYLVTYGDTSVNIIDLIDTQDMPPHVMIDTSKFNRIIDIQFASTAHGSYRCELMC